MADINFRKQFPINLFANVGFLIANVAIGIWMVPYLIGHLGIDGYGFIPLATSVTSYTGLIALFFNGAVIRYLVLALQKEDADLSNRVFNTAFWSLLLISVLLVPFAGLFCFILPWVFNIPLQLTGQIQCFFFANFIAFIFSGFSSLFSVSTVAHNRLDLNNMIDMSSLVVKTTLIVVFFVFFSLKLTGVGLAYMAGEFVALLLGYVFFRKLTPLLRISLCYFDHSQLRKLMSMGGWLFVNQIGAVFFQQMDLIVVNVLFGAHEAGKYGALIQWSFLLRSLTGVLVGVLIPMILISHAKNETQKIVMMTKQAVKLIGLGLGVLVGLLCGFSGPLLSAWLGKDFMPYTSLLWVLTSHLVVNLAIMPLFVIAYAYNRIKFLGIVTLVMGVGNFALAIMLAKFCGWGVYGIAAAGATILTLKNLFFMPLYGAHILGIPYDTFYRSLAGGIIVAMVTCGAAYGLNQFMVIDGWLKLFFAGSAVLSFSLIIGFILLGKDRTVLVSCLQDRASI